MSNSELAIWIYFYLIAVTGAAGMYMAIYDQGVKAFNFRTIAGAYLVGLVPVLNVLIIVAAIAVMIRHAYALITNRPRPQYQPYF